MLCAPLNGQNDNVGSLSYWQWFDFERAIFSSETVNRISRRLVSKVKYLYVETVKCIVRRRVLHVQPFPLKESLVLCFDDVRKRTRC